MRTDRRGAAYPLTHHLGWRQHFAHTSEPPEGKKMRLTNRLLVRISLAVLVVMISMTMPARAPAQGPAPAQGAGPGQGRGGPGGGGRGAQATPPQNPTAVTLPTVTGPITGPGQPYESVQSLAPGKGLANFKYEAKEYFISGTANG